MAELPQPTNKSRIEIYENSIGSGKKLALPFKFQNPKIGEDKLASEKNPNLAH